jgi:hypothetical protein
LAFVYIGNDIPNYHDLCSTVTGILDKLKLETV